jgi:hypothetical protein
LENNIYILYAKIHSIKLITYSAAFHWATAQPVIGPSQMWKVQPSLSLGLPKSGRYSFGNAWKILNGPKIINALGTKQHNITKIGLPSKPPILDPCNCGICPLHNTSCVCNTWWSLWHPWDERYTNHHMSSHWMGPCNMCQFQTPSCKLRQSKQPHRPNSKP